MLNILKQILKIILKTKNKTKISVIILILYIYYKYKKNTIKKKFKKTENNIQIYKNIKHIIKSFKPTPYLFNSDLQIIYGLIYHKFHPFKDNFYLRQILKTKDNGQFALDFYPQDFFYYENYHIIIFICGASGDSSDNYAKIFCEMAFNNNYRTVVINKRGFGNIKISSEKFLNFHDISDLKFTVDFLDDIFHNKINLYIVSVSMGSNYATKYIGKLGKNCKVKAAVAISNPWSLFKVSKNMQNNIKGKIYSKILANEFKKKILLHKEGSFFKKTVKSKKVDIDNLNIIDNAFKFDRDITSKLAGFNNIYDYYKNVSSENYIDNISIPFLCVNCEEDPICNFEYIPIEKLYANSNIIFLITQRGGHIEYFNGIKPKWWAFELAIEYININVKNNF